MSTEYNTESPGRLERSCGAFASEWCRSRSLGPGVDLLNAWFTGRAFEKHRHDTYAIGVTDTGVQRFDYRGAAQASVPGQIVVLHPDETHDGRAGDERGFGYRIVYVCPDHVFNAVATLTGKSRPLPFARNAVNASSTMLRAIEAAFAAEASPLACDALILELARGLLEEEGKASKRSLASLNQLALARGREFLDSELQRCVRSSELEAVSGLSRYEYARQFRLRYGTSPYRYSLLRRLDAVRDALFANNIGIADAAFRYGFADQAHLTRHFRAAFGVTPRRFQHLHSS